MKVIKLILAVAGFAASWAYAQVPIGGLPPATLPLTGSEVMLLNQNSLTRQTPITSLTAIVPPITAPFVLQAASSTLVNSRVLAGTSNEVIITDGGPLGNLTLATPQPIGMLNSPTFAGLTLTGLTGILIGHGASPLTVFGGVTCVNQFMRSLSATGTGVCNSVANTDLVNSSVTYNGLNVALGASGTLVLASSNFTNQGTTTTLLHGNAAGSPSWAQVANADLVNSSVTYNGLNVALGGSGTLLLASANYANQGTTTTLLHGNVAGNPSWAQVANADLVNSSVTYNGLNVALGGSGTLSLASSNFANQGTTTTVLHGNAAGNPSWAQISLTADVVNTLPAGNGGTGNSSYTLGDILYASAGTTLSKLAGNTTSTKQFLTQTGTGTVSAAPAWGAIAAGDLPGSFSGFANPTGTIGLAAVNGVATTAMRSDAAPLLSQSISPTWSGTHTFSNIVTAAGINATGATVPANGIYLSAANTLGLSTNTTSRLTINGTGNISVVAPSSGDVLTIAGDSGGRGIFLDYASGTGATNVVFQTRVPSGSTSIWRLTQNGVVNVDMQQTATTGLFSIINGGVISQTISNVGATAFPAVGTTASAANAFLDNAASNNLLRSTSSIRYKSDVSTIADAVAADVIHRLRPVRFHSKASADSHTAWFYGLIAEEVARVEPSLIVRDPAGRPDGVQYDRVQVFMLPVVQDLVRQVRWMWACILSLVVWNVYLTVRGRHD